jgi:hypothetical protein
MKSQLKKQRGIALAMALLFVAIFSSLAVGMFTLSGQNMLAARSLHTVNQARSSAESGLEVLRYYMSKIDIPGTTDPDGRFQSIVDAFTETSLLPNGFDCTPNEDGTVLSFGDMDAPIALGDNKAFCAQIWDGGVNGVSISVTGTSGDIDRTITSGFTYGTRKNSAFDFGVATKGPLALKSLSLTGVNLRVESDVYIESALTNGALNIQNASIAGDVKIVNPNAYVTMSGGQSSIGGEAGAAAIQNHVEIGVDSTEFPTPNAPYFEKYVNGTTLNSANVAAYQNNAVLENVRIAAGTNPKFTGNTIINGVLYIEQPNNVEFGGNVEITGIIVGDGSVTDNSQTNQLNFTGTVVSSSVANLPQTSQYAGLHDETGTFIMAPGFGVPFGGNFGTLNGCIAANGVRTYGSAGGVVGGSIVNYSTEPMRLEGSDIVFNRSGITDIPKGFNQEWWIYYNPSSYEEPEPVM